MLTHFRINSLLLACCSMLLMNNIHTTSTHTRHFPIVKCSYTPSTYESILMTTLRNINSTQEQFRNAADRLIELLVPKVVECLNTTTIDLQTPVAPCQGEVLSDTLEFVSVMRSGDVPLKVFSERFPKVPVNKFLIQRNEETAEPIFIYKKLSPTLAQASKVIVVEPMIATSGTLRLLINSLKELGVKEENIIVAAVCAAPEGLNVLNREFPQISVVLTVIDDCLNTKKYISPGIGDFGDRYFGT
jgi:uracil phosphoribosyltransferase